jgi:hypothetical protein
MIAGILSNLSYISCGRLGLEASYRPFGATMNHFCINDRVYVKEFGSYGTVRYTTVVNNDKPVCDVALDLPPRADTRQKLRVVRVFSKDLEKL